MLDEFPRRAFLLAAEVKRMLGVTNHKDWVAFLEDNPDFPKIVQLGRKSKGKPRLRYPKHKVYLWIEENCRPGESAD